jgi:hypothetical protein
MPNSYHEISRLLYWSDEVDEKELFDANFTFSRKFKFVSQIYWLLNPDSKEFKTIENILDKVQNNDFEEIQENL